MSGKKKKKKKREKVGHGAAEAALLRETTDGAKSPRSVRGTLLDLASHPAVAELLAAGLVALAARVRNASHARKDAYRAGDAAAEPRRRPADPKT